MQIFTNLLPDGDKPSYSLPLSSNRIRDNMAVDLEPIYAELAPGSGEAARESCFLWSLVDCSERIGAVLLLLTLLPLLASLAVVIVVLSRRSPLVRHGRVGHHGRELRILKFRTMWGSPAFPVGTYVGPEAALALSELHPKLKSDPRVTSRLASLCRKYSVDELPQLWHVIRGDMSLVGPRPQTELELRKFYGPDAARLLALKPGLSGLWQVQGRSSVDRDRRRTLDLYMVDHWSIKLYLRILKETVPTVVSGRDAW